MEMTRRGTTGAHTLDKCKCQMGHTQLNTGVSPPLVINPLKPSSYDRKVRAQPRTGRGRQWRPRPVIALLRGVPWRLLLLAAWRHLPAVRSRRTYSAAKPLQVLVHACSDSTPHCGGKGQLGRRRRDERASGGGCVCVRGWWIGKVAVDADERDGRTRHSCCFLPDADGDGAYCMCPIHILTCRCRGIRGPARYALSLAIGVDRGYTGGQRDETCAVGYYGYVEPAARRPLLTHTHGLSLRRGPPTHERTGGRAYPTAIIPSVVATGVVGRKRNSAQSALPTCRAVHLYHNVRPFTLQRETNTTAG